MVLSAHLGIIASAFLLFRFFPLWLAVLVFLPVCVVHQKYLSEWIHEAAHFNFVADRRWNDILINGLAGVFFGNSIAKHREGHMLHHRHKSFFHQADPDTCMMGVSTRSELIGEVLRDLCGYNAIRLFFFAPKIAGTKKEKFTVPVFLLGVAVFHLTVFFLLWSIGAALPYLLYYVSLLTLYPLLNRIRLYGQHAMLEPSGLARLSESSASRTIDAGFMDRLLFTSRVMMFHYEHHMYPQLPYRALEAIWIDEKEKNQLENPNQASHARYPILLAVYRGLDT